MNELIYMMAYDDYLAHHGIKGQKWGVRKYQNPDGSLTTEGKKRYGVNTISNNSNKFTRKIVMGEVSGIPGTIVNPWGAGSKMFGTHRETRLKNKIDKIKSNKQNFKSEETYNKKLSNAERKYNYQKEINTNREKYDSKVSTGKRALSRLLGGRLRTYYSGLRAENFSKARSLASTIGANIPITELPVILKDHYDKTKKHGAKFTDWAW